MANPSIEGKWAITGVVVGLVSLGVAIVGVVVAHVDAVNTNSPARDGQISPSTGSTQRAQTPTPTAIPTSPTPSDIADVQKMIDKNIQDSFTNFG